MRFVLSPGGEVFPDIECKLPGRGAYTCINSRCLLAALKQRQFSRAFKREIVACTPEEMVNQISGIMRNRILGYIGLANRAGKVISGSSMVNDALKCGHKPGIVLIAKDISPAIEEKVKTLTAVHRVASYNIMSKDEFGAILGKAPRSALAIKPSGFVTQLVQEIERYRNFLGEV